MAGAFRWFVTSRFGRSLLLTGLLAVVWVAWFVWQARPIARFEIPGSAGRFDELIPLPDGQTLVVIPCDPPPQSGAFILHRRGPFQLWDLATGRERLRVLGDNLEAVLHGFAPDGSWLLAGSDDGHRLTVIDGTTGRERAAFRLGDGGFAVAPDSRTLAVHGDDRRVHLWDAATGRVTAALPADHPVIAFAGDGRTLAVADPTVFPGGIHNPADWADPRFDCLDTARGGAQGSVRIWDVATGAVRATLAVPAFAYVSLALSPDGRHLALYRSDPPDGAWPLWDNRVENGALVVRRRIWTDVLQLWDTRSGQPPRTLATHPSSDGGSGRVEFSPDGRVLVVRQGGPYNWDADLLWDVAHDPPRPRNDWLDPLRSSGDRGLDTSIFPIFAPRGGRMLMPAAGTNAVELRDTADGRLQSVCRLPYEGRFGPDFAPDGRTFAGAIDFDASAQTRLEEWVCRLLGRRMPERFRVSLFDADTGAERGARTLTGTNGWLLGVSPDGESVWVRRDDPDKGPFGTSTVERWAIRTGRPPAWLVALTALGVVLTVADWRRSRRRLAVSVPTGGPAA